MAEKPPEIRLKADELSDCAWVPLEEIASRRGLSSGYLETTLPYALGSIGLSDQGIKSLLYPNPS